MKHLIFIFFFATSAFTLKAQCIWIYVGEMSHGVEIPIDRSEFDVVINDTIKKHMISKSDGSLGRISLEPGKYNVKISSPDYAPDSKNEIVVSESKTSTITFTLAKPGAIKEEEKTKVPGK